MNKVFSEIIPLALPVLNLLVNGSGKVIGDIQAIAAKASWQTVDQLENDAEVVALNYLPEDKAIFDGIIATLHGVEQTVIAVETKNSPAPATV